MPLNLFSFVFDVLLFTLLHLSPVDFGSSQGLAIQEERKRRRQQNVILSPQAGI